jgi:predicted metal-binding membrane protein
MSAPPTNALANSVRQSEEVAAPPSPSRAAERATFTAALAVFAVAAVLTIYLTRSMSGGMRMSGNWTMSMMWMVMPGQSWMTAALAFVGMWLAMMVAMMLPSSLPMLLLYRRAAAFRGESRLGLLTFAVGTGYFLVWTLFGVLAYLGGTAISRLVMTWLALSRIVPVAAGGALVLAGIYQLTPWKSACLKHCRDPLLLVAHHLHGGWRGALRLGIHHGVFCAACCWGLMLIQLVLGVMSLAVMAVVAVLIALEKVLAKGEVVARLTGYGAVLGGLVLSALSLFGR